MVADVSPMPNKQHFALIPSNGTLFDVPNLEELLGCGNRWQQEYREMHAKQLALNTLQRPVRQLVSVPTPGGLADQITGIITEFYMSFITNRVLRVTTYESMPNISFVFYSPYLQLFAPPHEFPTFAIDALRYTGRGKESPIIYCKGKNRFEKTTLNTTDSRFNFDHYGQLCLTHDERLADDIFLTKDWNKLKYNAAPVLLVASNRGRSYAAFRENPHHKESLAKLDMTAPENCYLCAFLFLFRPTEPVKQIGMPIWRQLTSDPNSVVISIKIRVGDAEFATVQSSEDIEKGYKLLQDPFVNQHFSCAQALQASLRVHNATRTRRIKLLLVTDSMPLRLAAKDFYGSRLITDLIHKPEHSNCAISHVSNCSAEVVAHAMHVAAADIISVSLADFHIAPQYSGFGRVGAWLSASHANEPRRHIFNMKKGVTRSCHYKDADQHITDSKFWSGI